MKNLQLGVFESSNIFNTGFMCGKNLYLHCFKQLPSDCYIGNIDGEKAYESLKTTFGHLIKSVHTYRFYDSRIGGFDFNETFIIMKNNCIIELDTTYCEIYHDGLQADFIDTCTNLMKAFKKRARRKPLEINLVINSKSGICLRGMEIKPTKLDLDLFYENDFAEVDKLIQLRLKKQQDRGIILLHGMPGTGKTTYLRYLVGRIKKKILFLSPEMAANIMDPEFIKLLIDNPDSVLVIEDAENIIMDRRVNSNSSVSNLLNISDGMLADFLNIQVICTFNSPLTLVDTALLRKGRLIARYEFGKLSISKSRKLSRHLGFDVNINAPMSIAEISNPGEQSAVEQTNQVIGFRRREEMMC